MLISKYKVSLTVERNATVRILNVKIDLKEAYFAVPLKLPEICEIPVGRESIPVYVPMFWSFFNSKNIYKINENTDFSLEKTLHQHHNLLKL